MKVNRTSEGIPTQSLKLGVWLYPPAVWPSISFIKGNYHSIVINGFNSHAKIATVTLTALHHNTDNGMLETYKMGCL